MSIKTDHKNIKLQASLRTVTGKKSKSLRTKGLVPATVYGKGFTPLTIELPLIDFQRTYRVAKETAVVYLQVSKDAHPTLITQIQRHPVSEEIIHVDFRRIDLTKKIETHVPVTLDGTSEAVSQKSAVLLTQTNELMVEALPANIPQAIIVNISTLKEIGDEIKVKDLQTSADYTISEDPEKVIVSAIAHKEESVVPETTAATPEVITEKAPAEEAGVPVEEEKK